RLDDGIAVAEVDFVDLAHARQRDHDAAADRQATAGEAGTGAARHERQVQLVAELDDRGDLFGRGRENDGVGPGPLDRVAVALVDDEFTRGGDDAARAEQGAEAVEQG